MALSTDSNRIAREPETVRVELLTAANLFRTLRAIPGLEAQAETARLAMCDLRAELSEIPPYRMSYLQASRNAQTIAKAMALSL